MVVTFFFSSFGYQFELIFASYNQLPDTSYLKLWTPNGLSKHLKGSQMIGLDLCTSAKLAVKWIILKWYYAVDLILDSIWIILVFYCKFCAFKIILNFAFHIFIFLSRNKPNIHNNIIDISSSQNVVNDYFSLTFFYLESKVIEGSHKGKIFFLIFGQFFSKSTFLRLWHFFLT